MNWDTAKGNWKQFRGRVKEEWGELTDDDLNQIEGRRERLVGLLQERYGIEQDAADRRVKNWEKSVNV